MIRSSSVLPQVVRNLAITGKRKLPRKNIYVDVEPEIINLEEGLARLGISRKQLVEIGIMCGTDYNARPDQGRPKDGPKADPGEGGFRGRSGRAGGEIESFAEIREFFLHPDVTDDYEIKMKKPCGTRSSPSW